MDNLIKNIENSGVVGAGGAGFPSHVKFNAEAEYILVNGAECEPLLRVDQQLMAEYAEDMVVALNACCQAVGAKEGIIGLKKKYYDAIAALNKAIEPYPNIRLHLLENVYPAGDEQYLVYELTGRIVPEGGIPLKVGTIVTNVETLINVKNAMDGIPVTEKFVTIAGAVRLPSTYKVPVGVLVTDLIDLAGGATVSNYKVIDGGPMMGKVMDVHGAVVTKSSKGYIILPEDHELIKNKEKDINQILKEAKTACCHCDLCTDVCPRYLLGHKLEPSKLMRIASYQTMGDINSSVDEAFLCCECGLCEQACIMNLQPWKLNIHLKKQLSDAGIRNSNNRAVDKVHPFKEYRGFPVSKLVSRLSLKAYDVKAPLDERKFPFDEVKVLSKQHIGAPSEPTVQKGEYVESGKIIFAAPEGKLGANIHAPIAGEVVEVNNQFIIIRK